MYDIKRFEKPKNHIWNEWNVLTTQESQTISENVVPSQLQNGKGGCTTLTSTENSTLQPSPTNCKNWPREQLGRAENQNFRRNLFSLRKLAWKNFSNSELNQAFDIQVWKSTKATFKNKSSLIAGCRKRQYTVEILFLPEFATQTMVSQPWTGRILLMYKFACAQKFSRYDG